GFYGVSFWMPTIIKSMGVTSPLRIGFLTAIPYSAATIVMLLTSRSGDLRRERRWHVAIPALSGGIGLVLSAVWAGSTTMAMAALTLATSGIVTSLPLFWSLPTSFLRGTAAAAGIALINSIGNLGGFVGPYAVGFIKDMTRSTNVGMYMLGGC